MVSIVEVSGPVRGLDAGPEVDMDSMVEVSGPERGLDAGPEGPDGPDEEGIDGIPADVACEALVADDETVAFGSAEVETDDG